MNKFTLGITAAVLASMLLTGTILASPMAMTNIAAGLPTIFNIATAQTGNGILHEISMTAETLPNGQDAYKMVSHNRMNSTGPTTAITGYAPIATIPGPTIIVNPGDAVKVTLTNNIAGKSVGFNVPGMSNSNAKAATGQSKTYTFTAGSAADTYLYYNKDSALLGLFGALIVNPVSGPVSKYIEAASGAITPVNAVGLDREYILFMVGSTFWGQEINDGTQTPLWTNPMLGSELEEIVRFHILSVGPGHTFHLHAHRWVESMTNNNIIDTKLMEDGFDTHVFAVQAGADVGEGSWQYHCHVFAHMEAGMHGTFDVGMPTSMPGASPYAAVFGTESGAGLVTFEITDEPGRWFRSARGAALEPITATQSLELAKPGDSVNFVMSETNTVHTITSLIWPTGADHMPMDEVQSYKGGGIVQLNDAGLYVFTCKVHPYMFAAVVVDDAATAGLDLGETIDIAVPGNTVPTLSDLAARLLRTFWIATNPDSWQVFQSTPSTWHINYPIEAVEVRLTGGVVLPLNSTLSAIYGNDLPLEAAYNPTTPGVGEVWINTQFEKTTGKTKPGAATAVNVTDWTVTRKVALPSINMNNPHNMWTDDTQTVIYQTEWFDNKLTTFDRSTGALISQVKVGEAPSHVMTRTDNGDIHVALNGEEGVAEIKKTNSPSKVDRIIAMQGYGQDPTHPHAHWMSHDGKTMVTPNTFTHDSTLYGFTPNTIIGKEATGGLLPIATGAMPDSSKYYVANLLTSNISVMDMDTGALLTTINLLEDYNPVAFPGSGISPNGNDHIVVGALPIQTPVSPNGIYMVTANTLSATITIVDTRNDTAIATLGCDAGCHGVNFGAKQGGGYYAYVSSKFSNAMLVVDADPNNDGDLSDAAVVGRILLTEGPSTAKDYTSITANEGMGGQGVLAIPNVYNGWVQNLPMEWKSKLTLGQQNPYP